MTPKFKVRLKKRPIKLLEKINEPYYSNIKKAIYSLTENLMETERERDYLVATIILMRTKQHYFFD